MDHNYALIMAGGGGTRLWPMSRLSKPKQLLSLIDDRTLFKTSVDRLQPLYQPEQIYVITGRQYVAEMQADTPEIPAENFIVEPSGKDTAPAAALAITVIAKRDPEAIIALLTADHHIAREDWFRDAVAAGIVLAQEDYIVTLGISPTYPATGFGYIKQAEKIKDVNGQACYFSAGFREKPNAVTATEFVASGKYTWNSGMFIWKAKRALGEFERQQPQMYNFLQTLSATIDTDEFEQTLEMIWEKMPKISIDFAIMESAENIAVIPVDIGWSDVGSWGALFDVLDLDKFGNCFKGKNVTEHVILETRNSMVYSDRMTATIGVEDIIVIDTEDVLLICHKSRAQEVKDVVNHLRSIGKHDYL
jgi:mannose-1-phosphate guanylyltransferase